MKNTGKNLQTLQDNNMILLLEKNNAGFFPSVMGGKDVKSEKRILVLLVYMVRLWVSLCPMMKLRLIKMWN